MWHISLPGSLIFMNRSISIWEGRDDTIIRVSRRNNIVNIWPRYLNMKLSFRTVTWFEKKFQHELRSTNTRVLVSCCHIYRKQRVTAPESDVWPWQIWCLINGKVIKLFQVLVSAQLNSFGCHQIKLHNLWMLFYIFCIYPFIQIRLKQSHRCFGFTMTLWCKMHSEYVKFSKIPYTATWDKNCHPWCTHLLTNLGDISLQTLRCLWFPRSTQAHKP